MSELASESTVLAALPQPKPGEKAMEINGGNVVYEILGETGDFIALTPGGRFSKDIPGLRPLAEALVEGGYRVLLWDRPNCGKSDVQFYGQSESHMRAETLYRLITALGIGPCFILGGSGGARDSMLTTMLYPEIVRKLVGVTGAGLFGAFAEQVCVPAAGLTRIPDGVDDRTAAAFGVAHRTAYHTLRSVARIQAGDDVIVLGAGGGVGMAAVQLAATLGARVTAVASSDEKLAVAARYGADALVNHAAGDLRASLREALPDGAHAVLDPVGGELSEPALRTLRRGGRFVTIGYASGVIPRIPLNLVLVKGVHVLGFQFQDIAPDEFARNETELRELLVTAAVRPHIGAVYPLAEARAALQLVAAGRAVGKVVIELRAP